MTITIPSEFLWWLAGVVSVIIFEVLLYQIVKDKSD